MILDNLRPALVIVAALTLLTGLAYPLSMTGIAQLAFPAQSNGSLVVRDGTVVGSSLIGQGFADPRYFHGRPSATTATDPTKPGTSIPAPYNAASSSGSNLGPTNAALIDRVKADAARLTQENPGIPVPPDLVTTSASGLDPDISPGAAFFQVPRVAKIRGLSEDQVRHLVETRIEPRSFGLLGEPHVNVLSLNLALDAVAAR